MASRVWSSSRLYATRAVLLDQTFMTGQASRNVMSFCCMTQLIQVANMDIKLSGYTLCHVLLSFLLAKTKDQYSRY